MTDRIAELRARLDYEGTLDDMDIEHLLDCAEALQAVLATLEWQAHGGCRATDGPIMSSADAVAMGKAALAALNGADNE